MVTLRDVARRVGVSPKTVSRVVNEDPAVTPETRKLVLEEIERLNYVPNQAARMMRTATSPVVGLMTDVVATTPYSVDIVRGVQSGLLASGRTLLIANTEGQARIESDYWRVFRSHNVAGTIYATMFHRECTVAPQGFTKPVVLVNCFAADGARPTILPDDEDGGYWQARHLLELGHRRIGTISLNPAIRATGLRAAGAARAFAEAGVSGDGLPTLPGFVGPVEVERFVAFAAAMEMLAGADRPTAVICGNDMIAIQVYCAAARLGLAIPDDLSVIGYDDLAMFALSLYPNLTTVRLPYFEMGRVAVDLIEPAARALAPGEPVLVPCPLVVRDSCRPPV